jgi:hypothetical protein
LDLNIGPAAVDFIFDFSCHRDGHAHSSRIKIRDIEDPYGPLGGDRPVDELAAAKG